MYEAIKFFYKQFSYEPKIVNRDNFVQKSKFVIAGMGGSAHAALILKTWKPELDIIIHRNYSLPKLPMKELKNRLIILSSYSGNTEEPIDAFKKAKENNLNMAVVAASGKLLLLAKENNIPYIELPDKNIQPRAALGLSTMAFLKFMGEEDGLNEIRELTISLNKTIYEEKGKALAEKIKNHIPVIYASDHNYSLVYIWKIKLNETGKIPAFCNIFPELNHTEMISFNIKDSIRELCNKFSFIILKDKEDSPKILKRMKVTEKLYKNRGLDVETLELEEGDAWHKIFSCLLLADWTSYYTALGYGLEPNEVLMVEKFKKLILE